jgi:hypothetical protein
MSALYNDTDQVELTNLIILPPYQSENFWLQRIFERILRRVGPIVQGITIVGTIELLEYAMAVVTSSYKSIVQVFSESKLNCSLTEREKYVGIPAFSINGGMAADTAESPFGDSAAGRVEKQWLWS